MKKKDSHLLLLMLITGIGLIISLMFYTIPNETKDFKDMSLSERLNVYYKNFHPEFDYINGIWLSFSGVFTILCFEYLEIPNPFIIYNKKMIQLKKLINKKFKKKK